MKGIAHHALLAAALLFSSLAACGDMGSPAQAGIGAPPGSGNGGPSSSSSGGGAGGAATGDGGTSGLPCDVLSLLQSTCVSCHSSPPIGGAPMPMVTYADLVAPARSDPSKTVAEVAVTRMQSTTAPMPPAGNTPPTAQEITAFQAWVSAGAPATGCAGVDAGSAASPYDTPVTCSSMVTSNSDEGPTMRPGDACLSCHSPGHGEAPVFSIGGTVYKTAHEPTLCEGVNVASATVVITDANGGTVSIPVTSAGNFYWPHPVAAPFHAKVVHGGAERAMSAAQTSGDCNSCHTETGANGAPGRIMLP